MKKAREKNDEILREYDFSQGVRGRYAQRYARGSNVVVLEPDVAKGLRCLSRAPDPCWVLSVD